MTDADDGLCCVEMHIECAAAEVGGATVSITRADGERVDIKVGTYERIGELIRDLQPATVTITRAATPDQIMTTLH